MKDEHHGNAHIRIGGHFSGLTKVEFVSNPSIS